MKRCLLILLLWCSPAWGQSVTFPSSEIKSKAGRPIFVSPTVDGDELRWEVPAGGLDDWIALLPPDVGAKFGNAKIFYGDRGTYIVRAWTAKVVGGKAKLSDIATLTIIIDGGGPPPPPPPVDPTDPFTTSVLSAYAQDGKPAAQAAQLAAVYRNSGPAIRDAADLAGLLKVMHAAAASLIDTAMPNVRNAIRIELNARLGTTNRPLDDSIRALVTIHFSRVKTALEACR